MNVTKYIAAYSKKKNKKTPDEIINKVVEHPQTMRRLVALFEDKVNLADPSENVWYNDMQKCNLSVQDVALARDFVNFCIVCDRREHETWMKNRYSI